MKKMSIKEDDRYNWKKAEEENTSKMKTRQPVIEKDEVAAASEKTRKSYEYMRQNSAGRKDNRARHPLL